MVRPVGPEASEGVDAIVSSGAGIQPRTRKQAAVIAKIHKGIDNQRTCPGEGEMPPGATVW